MRMGISEAVKAFKRLDEKLSMSDIKGLKLPKGITFKEVENSKGNVSVLIGNIKKDDMKSVREVIAKASEKIAKSSGVKFSDGALYDKKALSLTTPTNSNDDGTIQQLTLTLRENNEVIEETYGDIVDGWSKEIAEEISKLVLGMRKKLDGNKAQLARFETTPKEVYVEVISKLEKNMPKNFAIYKKIAK